MSADLETMDSLGHLATRLEALSSRGTAVERSGPAAELALVAAERQLDVCFPAPVRDFYRRINGFAIAAPAFRAFGVEELTMQAPGVLPFAVFDGAHIVAFRCDMLNVASQWDLVVLDGGSIMTHSMASFYTNKIWAWLQRGRRVWAEGEAT